MSNTKGVLVDLTKCIGCGSCSVACKLWNGTSFDKEKPATNETGKDAILNDKNWTIVTKHEVKNTEGKPIWRFVKQQCMHCVEPACVSACFSKALQKDENGAVVYYPDLCVGCRYCLVACPFDVPKYEWEKALPLVTKCQMCSSRIANGDSPACVGVCPTNVMKFGNRDELLKEAERIVANNPQYVRQIYGATEVGGTSWLYISDVDFGKLGFKTNLESIPPSTYTQRYLSKVPFLAVGWGAFLAGLAYYSNRRMKLENERQENSSSHEK